MKRQQLAELAVLVVVSLTLVIALPGLPYLLSLFIGGLAAQIAGAAYKRGKPDRR